jgi:hypothetical protein
VERSDNRLLAATLSASADEHAADLADQCALHPEAGLIEEIAHLCAHVAEAGGRSEDDGVEFPWGMRIQP